MKNQKTSSELNRTIKTGLTIIFTIVNLLLFAQNPKLDSLWNEYKNAKHDTIRIKFYLDIGDAYEYEKPDTALYYYHKAVELADKATIGSSAPAQTVSAFALLKATSLRYIGFIHSDQGSYAQAIEYYLKSLKIIEEL
ncbi:MAG: tetratricopeptide repeat protein [Bacteroidia bacterium]|nr:tetratricopeptide repeat protein [Bacteroidia bacterium]